jgi:hypothetical protein
MPLAAAFVPAGPVLAGFVHRLAQRFMAEEVQWQIGSGRRSGVSAATGAAISR